MNTKINNNLNITEGTSRLPNLQYSSPSVVSEKDEYKMINEIKNQIEILLSLLGDQDSEKKKMESMNLYIL